MTVRKNKDTAGHGAPLPASAPDPVQAARALLAQQAEAGRAQALAIFQDAVTQMRALGWTPAPQTIIDGRGITQMIIIVPYQQAGPPA